MENNRKRSKYSSRKYSVYKDKTEDFLDSLDDKLDKIKNDDKLKSKMKEYSKTRARKMAKNIIRMDENLENLKSL